VTAPRTASAAIRVMVVDDQPPVADGLATILDGQPDIEVVALARDGRDALAKAAALPGLDVVLMDIRMPVMDGIEATRRMLAGPGTGGPRVVILTTFDLDAYVYDALRAGASGFLLKRCTRDELINAVRVVAAGEALLAPSVTRRLLDRFAAGPDGPPGAPGTDQAARQRLRWLTNRELEVFDQLAAGRSNAEIAAALFLTEHTVKTHVSRILAKTGLRDRVQAVIFAYQTGLVGPARPPAPAAGPGRQHGAATPPLRAHPRTDHRQDQQDQDQQGRPPARAGAAAAAGGDGQDRPPRPAEASGPGRAGAAATPEHIT
jgi:DNA-binding NarL/FixJ family response regulator